MNFRNIVFTANQLLGADGVALLLAVRKRMLYENGKPTDKIEGYMYDIVAPQNGYQSMSIKIKGDMLITNEQIAQKGGAIKVKFKNMVAKAYRDKNGEYAISASADGLEVI